MCDTKLGNEVKGFSVRRVCLCVMMTILTEKPENETVCEEGGNGCAAMSAALTWAREGSEFPREV